MDPQRFDSVARLLAARRLSRRCALAAAGASLVPSALAAAQSSAPTATPTATPASSSQKPEVLFVQGYASGSLAPAAEGGGFTLTLNKGLGHTIYFSDRPERIVGAVPTDKFLKAMTFPAANPPNAALLMQVAPNDEDVAVVELTNPTYDATTGTATFTANVLSNYQTLGFTFQETPQTARSVHQEFGAASLFIDDGCGHHSITCCAGFSPDNVCIDVAGSFTDDFCWDFGDFCCHPCEGDASSWTAKCNSTYSSCNGNCVAATSACW